jgi:hypothetical protein
MKDGYTRITAHAGFDGQATRRDYYFKTRNTAREFRLRIKRWKAEQKSPADNLSFDNHDKRWLAYLRVHIGNLELLPAIVIHWERRHYLETLTREEGKSWFALRRSIGTP